MLAEDAPSRGLSPVAEEQVRAKLDCDMVCKNIRTQRRSSLEFSSNL